jgi:hypothetical protein
VRSKQFTFVSLERAFSRSLCRNFAFCKLLNLKPEVTTIVVNVIDIVTAIGGLNNVQFLFDIYSQCEFVVIMIGV